MNNHNKPELPAVVRISRRTGSIIGRQLTPPSRANPARHCPRQQQSLLPSNPDSSIKICLRSKLAFTRSVKRLFGGGETRAAHQHQDHLIAQTGFTPTAAAAVHLPPKKTTMATMPNANANKSMPSNLLVTGGCGFIGSNFINYIFDKWPEAKFVNIDKLDYGASPEHILPEIRTSLRYVFMEGTLLDQPLVEDILRRHQIDMIIHFAAITHVDDSYSDRIGTIQENVIATTTLLEAINAYGQLKRLVHISTDEVYGDSIDDLAPKNEQSPLNPTNPYAASKAACEVIVRSYHHSYKLPYVMNNVYGPRQAYSKLIPKFTRLALEGKPYPLMGDGMHTRSWMYVDDCAEAIRRVTENGRIGEVYNIGTEFEKSNLHLTEMLHEKVQKLMAREATKIAFKPIPDRPYHDRRYHIDFAKIRDELAWTCMVPFEEGLTRTLDFYVKEYQRAQKEQTVAERPHG